MSGENLSCLSIGSLKVNSRLRMWKRNDFPLSLANILPLLTLGFLKWQTILLRPRTWGMDGCGYAVTENHLQRDSPLSGKQGKRTHILLPASEGHTCSDPLRPSETFRPLKRHHLSQFPGVLEPETVGVWQGCVFLVHVDIMLLLHYLQCMLLVWSHKLFIHLMHHRYQVSTCYWESDLIDFHIDLHFVKLVASVELDKVSLPDNQQMSQLSGIGPYAQMSTHISSLSCASDGGSRDSHPWPRTFCIKPS